MVRRLPRTVVGLLLAASACGGEERSTRSPDEAFCERVTAAVDSFIATFPRTVGDRYGGTVVVGALSEIADGMNGLVSADYFASQHQMFVALMTMIQYDEDLEPKPYLARSWEVSEDLGELIFHLRDDVYWHDGKLTTAYDVEFTYLRATDPRTGFPNSSFWTSYIPGPSGIEVVDSFTVLLRLRPHAEYLDPWRATAVLPRHLLEDVPPEHLRQHPYGVRCPVGNGPFRFVEHRQDQSWSFEANPSFPAELGGRPFVDRYVYRVIPEQTTLLSELLTGGIDVYINPLPDQALAIMESDAARLIHFPFRDYLFVGWNSRRPQLADARVRRAITMAVDRQEILQALQRGYGRVANAGVPPFHWGYDPSVEEALPYDPDRAAALLEEAGWLDREGEGLRKNADGLPLTVSIKYNQGNQQRRDIAEIMQAQLREVGVQAVPRAVEWATLLQQIGTPAERDFDGVVMAWVTEFRVDDTDLFHSRRIDEPFALAGMRDARLDTLLDTLALTPSREAAVPYWHELQSRIVELQPFTYFFHRDRLEGIGRRLNGVIMDARGEWVTIRGWWIPADQRKYASGDTSR